MQISYSQTITTALQGQVADDGPSRIVSRVTPADEIKIGVGVVKDTDDGTIKLPDTSGDVFEGIAIRDITVTDGEASADNTFPADAQVPIMKQGRVWVQVEEAVTPASDVYCRYTTSGGNTQKGAFRTDADTAKAFQVTQARFLSTTGGAGIALLEINLP